MLGLRETDRFNRFDININDKEFYKQYGYYHCFDIGYDDPEDVVGKDEIITICQSATIIFNYPLSGEFRFKLKKSEGSITRKDFASFVQSTYRRIYDEESSGQVENIVGMLNRQKTDGPYGIWGHHIGDLVIEGVRHTGNNVYTLIIGS